MDQVTFISGHWWTDQRGGFLRLLTCSDELFGGATISQVSLSTNDATGTLRGFHALQRKAKEWKAISCIRGAIHDVLIDCRPESPTYQQVETRRLSAESPGTVIVPPGVAHAYITLTDDAWLMYAMSSPYDPDLEVGFRWNDAQLGVDWPSVPTKISDKDAGWPLLEGPAVL